ncbi:MAG: NAD(P)H-dependent oxidoreductase subunit E [Phycisphaeraceae bacterium]|nr:NAD(P)H-dependent oxidoreductase subunit E [Phycisphaeraceae bacterium]
MSENLIALQNKFLGQGQTVYDQLSQRFAQQGYLSDDDIRSIAETHNLPPQHVRATAKFYEQLSHNTPAKHTLKLCNGEACQTAGSMKLETSLCSQLQAHVGSTSDQGLRVAHVTCLGYCGSGPNAMIDGLPVSLAKAEDVNRVARHLRVGAPHGLSEPVNHCFRPAAGEPCVLMRHFDQDVVSLQSARRAGVYKSLEKAVTTLTPQQVIDQVTLSRLRGRGGAGFPTGTKLQMVANAESKDGSGRKFVVVNFDEGDAGSYIDKELIERDPHTQLEGILLAAYACGACEAFIYVRFEYPRSMRILRHAIDEAIEAQIIGPRIFGSKYGCVLNLVQGQGAYICGEETSLLRSIEGVPAMVSYKPPFPAQEGLWGCPTAVINVETLHNLPWIMEHGGDAYAKLGYKNSRGTKMVSFNRRVKNPGVYEVELGITLRELIVEVAGGMAKGQTFKAVQIGGPLGGVLPQEMLDTPLDFESLAAVDGILGHAGIVVYSQEDDLMKVCRGLMAFCAVESCGKCFPCRIGSVRGTELFDQMIETGVSEDRLSLLRDLCETMRLGSLCALGGMIPLPIECLMKYFPKELARYRPSTADAAVTTA